MKKAIFTSVLLVLISVTSYGQKDTSYKLSPEASKDLMKQLFKDTTVFLRNAADNACKCIDSLLESKISRKTKSEIFESVSVCIDKEVTVYELSIKLFKSMSSNEKNKNIVLSGDKKSTEYKRHYFELEEYLRDTCKSLKELLVSNNKESEKSTSEDRLAIQNYNKGIDFVKEENYAEALPFFKKAVELDAEFAFAWDNLGLCNRKLGNLDEALEAYQKSLAIDPNGSMPLQNIPVVYEFKKEYDKALTAYDNIHKIYPDDPESYYGAGRIYFAYKKDDEKALQSMCKAYNAYVKLNSPYRADAQKIIQYIYASMKKDGKEDKFNAILKENNIKQLDK
jgi:tetratricopeptide (TPR) repeat protein